MSLLSEIRGAVGRWALGSEDDVSDAMMADALAKSGLAEAPEPPPQAPPEQSAPLVENPGMLERLKTSLVKAAEATGFPQPTKEMPRSMFYDPYAVLDWGGWRQRPSALAASTLRAMSEQTAPITAIIGHRQNQVSSFARPQQGQYDKGFRIILRERRDTRKQMSDAEAKEAARIERYIEQTGVLRPGERVKDRDSFRTFSKKFVGDQLMYDQACFEIMRDRVGRPSQFKMLPSETIFPAVADLDHVSPQDVRDRISHVQVFQQTPIAEYGPDDLAFAIMNPRSSLDANGFGFPPVEKLTQLVTAWLFGFGHNQKFFQQGSAIKGFVNIKGAIPDRQLRSFRRQWYSMITGAANAWKTPILNAEGVEWHSMHSTNREMEFGGWMDWLTKLICAIYGIDPVELNFNFSSSGGGSTMFESRPNAHEVLESKDKGLRPLMDHMQDVLNQELIWPINPDFEFSYVGFDAKAESQEREARISEGKSFRTVNEIRDLYQLDPLDDGDIILDTVYQQAASQAAAEAEGEGGEDDAFLFGDESDAANDDAPDDPNPTADGAEAKGEREAAAGSGSPGSSGAKPAFGKAAPSSATDRLAKSLAEVIAESHTPVDDNTTARRRWLPGGA